ncbi:MAG: type II toxin-antitoxin system VapC family toxin [Terriglobales bacterium]
MKADVKRFVVDASVAVAWCFPDEATPFTEGVLRLFAHGAQGVVPSIWPLEIANALVAGERRKRISMAQTTILVDRIAHLAISVEGSDPARSFGEVLSLARQERLTLYDAAYAELALRLALPLASLDDELRRAALRIGIPLVSI